ncbi:MAG: hypothetical protein ABJB12_07885 [Pseudomonadota bacterium]
MNAQLMLVLLLLGVLGFASSAHAGPAPGPELNPFSCIGDAEAASEDRSIAQIRSELDKKLDPPFVVSDPLSIRAEKLCVIAQLKARVGDTDAIDYFEQAIFLNPDEPGYDLFAGNYYGGARGAKGPVLESAEKYLYRALEKLEKLRQRGRFRGFHSVVHERVQRALLTLYQQDGVPLLPWKAFPQASSGYLAPGLSLSTQVAISRDTRDGLGGSDTQAFTAEAGLFKVRRGLEPSARNLYDIVRQPLRLITNTELRLRHTYLGAIDLSYGTVHAERAALTTFGEPSMKNDIDVKQVGVAYERVIPLYPLFDLKLALGVKQVERRGVVEYLPNCSQTFPVYEARPSVSRFISSDKLTVSGVLTLMNIPDVQCEGQQKVSSYLNVRGRTITGLNLEYAIYSPLLLPALGLGSLRPYRTSTRGLYLSAGYVNDNEVFGDRRVVNETFFAGARLEGPGSYDIAFQETYYAASGTVIDNGGLEQHDPNISGTILRSALTITRRLTNPDETPGVPSSWGPFGNGSLNWVFPLSFDKVLSGYDQLENVRAGTALWWKVFGTGLGGSTLLVTAGYDYGYFYHLGNAGHRHNVGITLRLGWRDL